MQEVDTPVRIFRVSDRRLWLLAVPIAAIIFVSFWSVTRHGFVSWDDDANFVGNPYYRGLGWAHLRWAWTTFLIGVYQPVAWMLLETEYAAFALDPRGYHLVSVLLHIVNSVILYVLTIALIGRAQPALLSDHPWKCFVSAASLTTLFGVHPLRTEVVAWVSCQPYLPCALFYLLAIAAYLQANPPEGEGDRRWFWGSYALFIAALLSKAVAVSLPFVLVILDAYPLNRLTGGLRRWFAAPTRVIWFEKLPFVAASVAFMVVAMWARKDAPILSAVQPRGLSGGQLPQVVYGVAFYIGKTLLPTNITAYYGTPVGMDWFDPPFLIPIVATIATTAFAFFYRRAFPAAIAAWIGYIVMLAPNLGLIRNAYLLGADRYSYLPFMSLVVLGAGSLAWWWSGVRRRRILSVAVVTASLVAIAVLGVLTQAQSRTWQSEVDLWTHAVNHGQGEVVLTHHNLGLALLRESRLDEAAQQFREAIRLNNRSAGAHNSLGVVLAKQERLAQATDEFGVALRLDPQDVEAHINMGSVLFRQQKVELAIKQYARALELAPDNAQAARNLGRILAISPPRDSRLVDAVQGLLREPTDTSARRTLADALKPYE